MNTITGLPLIAAASLLCALSAIVFVVWHFLFHRELPLRRRLAEGTGPSRELWAFAEQLLAAGFSPFQGPSALEESGRAELEALSRRSGGVDLAWVRRRRDGRAELIACRGKAWPRVFEKAVSFDEDLLSEAVEARCVRRALAPGASGLEGELSRLGGVGLAAAGWGGGPESRGAAAALSFLSEGTDLDALEPYLRLAAAFAGIWTQAADSVSELSTAHRRLESGLSSTMEELSLTHDRLIKKSREARAFHDVATTMAAASPRSDSALGAVLAIIARYLEADLAAVLLLDEETGELVAQPGAYGLESEVQLYRIPLSQDNSSSVRAFKTGRPFMTGDAQKDPGVIPYYTRLWKIHSLMVMPIYRQGMPIGVVRVGSRKPGDFKNEDLELVRVAADKIAVIVETAILNRRLSKAMERLEALSRIKDEFVSTVSHEFKTPLTTLTGFLQVLMEGDAGPLTGNQKKFLIMSDNAVKRLSTMVSELLDIAKIEAQARLEMRSLRVEDILRVSVETHSPEAQRQGKRISEKIAAGLPEVMGDARWLSLVVDNLISNALKFTRPGGHIQVSAQEKGGFLMVSVEDDGVGIPPEDRERIFEKFFRSGSSKLNVAGTGLGLAIAQQAILRHGGRIWCESEIGRGSRFHFVLPVVGSDKAGVGG